MKIGIIFLSKEECSEGSGNDPFSSPKIDVLKSRFEAREKYECGTIGKENNDVFEGCYKKLVAFSPENKPIYEELMLYFWRCLVSPNGEWWCYHALEEGENEYGD